MLKLKHITPSEAYGAMVSWTISLAYIVEKMQMAIVSQTHLTLQIPINLTC